MVRRAAGLAALTFLLGAGALVPASLPRAEADGLDAEEAEVLASDEGVDVAAPVLGLLAYGDEGRDVGLLGDGTLREDSEEPRRDPWFLREWLRESADGAGGQADDLSGDLFTRAHVAVEIETDDGRTVRGEIATRLGRRGAWSRTVERTLLSSYDPELACDNSGGWRPSAAGRPRIEPVRSGVAVDARVFAAGEPDRLAVEALVQWGALEEPVERVALGARFLGHVDLPRFRGGALLVSGSAKEGEAIETRVARGGRVLRVRLVPRLDRAGSTTPSGRIRRLDAGLATLGAWEVPVASAPLLFLGRAAPALAMEALVARLAPIAGEAREASPAAVWVGGEPESVAAAVGVVDDVLRSRSRTIALEVLALADGEDVARFETIALAGRTAWLRIGTDRAFLDDPETEVG